MHSLHARELVPPGFSADGALSGGDSTVMTIRAMSANSPCPSCRAISNRVHSCQYILFAPLQNRIESSQDDHRRNDVTVFSANIEVSKNVVRDSPYEIRDPTQVIVIHASAPFAARQFRHRINGTTIQSCALSASVSDLFRRGSFAYVGIIAPTIIRGSTMPLWTPTYRDTARRPPTANIP